MLLLLLIHTWLLCGTEASLLQQESIRQQIHLQNHYRDDHITQRQNSPQESWSSKACRNFYAGSIQQQQQSRCTTPQLRVLEDFHPGGRAQASRQPAQEVVVSHEYQFVYVEVRKAASASIRALLQDVFAANFSWCLYSPRSPSCKLIRGGRCTSLCLTQDMLENYFFFTFVRHPGQRFLAAFHQLLQHHKQQQQTLSMQHVLTRLLLNYTTADEHIQTQSFALSSSCPADQGQIPLDFIGKVEQLTQDWPRLLRILETHARKPLPTPFPALPNRHQEEQEEKTAYEALATPHIRALTARTYAQDFVCLGYSMAGWMNHSLLPEQLGSYNVHKGGEKGNKEMRDFSGYLWAWAMDLQRASL